MATNLGTLTLNLATKISEFTGPMDTAEKKAKSSTDSIGKSFDFASDRVKLLGAAVAGTVTSIMSLDKIIDVQRTFDKLNASLVTATGSTQGAAQAFSVLQKFAQQTPYGLEQSIEAFTKLVNLGLTPSKQALTSYGNTASAMGKDLNQMIEAVADATTGEFERLKEFGIKSSQQNGKVALTFKGITTTINNSSKDIEKYLINLGETDFAGAMDNRMKTLDGSISNLEDTIDAFVLKVSQSGIGSGIKTGVDAASDAITALGNNIDTVKAIAVALGTAFTTKLVVGMTLSARATVFATAENIRYQMTLASMAATAEGATTTMIGFRAVMAALGGPAGLLMLGTQAVAAGAAFLYMKKSSSDTKDALEEQGMTIDQLRDKYSKLTSEQLKIRSLDAADKIKEQNEKISDSFGTLTQYINELTFNGQKDKADALSKYMDDIQAGGTRAEQALKNLESRKIITDDQLRRVSSLGQNVKDARLETDKQNEIIKLVNKSADDSISIIKKQNDVLTDQARIIGLTAKQWTDLTNTQKEYATKVGNEALKKAYIADKTKNGMTYEQANFNADAITASGGSLAIQKDLPDWLKTSFKAMGIKTTNPNALTPETQKIIDTDWANSGNFVLSDSDKKKMAGALALSAINGFENVAKNGGLPSNLLTALIAQESGGKNVSSPTGAQGFLQTTASYREQHGITVQDNTKNPVKVAQSAVNDLNKAYEYFGSWSDAIMAYNGGIAGVKALKAGRISDKVTAKGGYQIIDGQGYVSPAKASEMQKHANQVLKYTASMNGNSAVDQTLYQPSQNDYLKWQNEQASVQKALKDTMNTLDQKYAPALTKLDLEHKKTVQDLNEQLSANPEKLKEVIAKENNAYELQRNELIASKKAEYQQYFEFETDRITQIRNSYAKEKSLIDSSIDLDKQQKIDAKNAKDRQMQDEIDAEKRAQKERINSAYEAYSYETAVLMKRYQLEREEIAKTRNMFPDEKIAKLQANTMDQFHTLNASSNKVQTVQQSANEYLYQRNNPNGKAIWDMQNQYDTDSSSLTDDYNNNVAGINEISDAKDRNEKLLQAHDQYLQSKKALDEKYAAQQSDLMAAQTTQQLSTYSGLFGSLADIVQQHGSKQSAAYRVMFTMQQAFSIASATAAAWSAYSQAFADPSAMTLPQKLAGGATVMSALMPAISSIANLSFGYSNGGYTGDGGVFEPAGVVHKGEVVFSQADIARLGGVSAVEGIRKGIRGYSDGGVVGGASSSISSQLSGNSSQSQGDVNISVSVADSGVTTSGASTDNQKQLGQMIGNAVRTVIRQEQRQGGLLSK